VLSTIHTNSAIETLTRIDNLGVPPFLMASTIELIIAQRLVRRLCQKCKIVDQPEQKTLDRIKTALGNIGVAGMVTKEQIDNPVFWKGNPGGCSECDGIGYKGRVGLYEIMSMNNEIRRMILDKASALDIEKTAMKNGMVTLEQDGVLKAQQGMTSLEEIYRVAKRMEL
jgi:type IV pilus assembly protein PilB